MILNWRKCSVEAVMRGTFPISDQGIQQLASDWLDQLAEIERLTAIVERLKTEIRCLRAEEWDRESAAIHFACSLASDPLAVFKAHKAKYY